MRYRYTWRIVALGLAVALLSGLRLTAQESLRPTHVIVIVMDGARPDAIQQIGAPVLLGLAESGAVTWDAETVLPSVTVPAHASLFTGLPVDVHGVTHNTYTTERLGLPTFLSLAADADYAVAMVVGKNRLDQFHYPESVAYTFAREGDRSAIDAAIAYLDAGAEMLFVHLPNPDYFGHLTGWMSATYLFELGNTDAQIGRLLEALDDRDLRDSTLLIITADHGGHDRVHGTDRPEDRLIPLIVVGPGVPPGTDLGAARISQVAPTVLRALGLPIPEAMDAPLPVP